MEADLLVDWEVYRRLAADIERVVPTIHELTSEVLEK